MTTAWPETPLLSRTFLLDDHLVLFNIRSFVGDVDLGIAGDYLIIFTTGRLAEDADLDVAELRTAIRLFS